MMMVSNCKHTVHQYHKAMKKTMFVYNADKMNNTQAMP